MKLKTALVSALLCSCCLVARAQSGASKTKFSGQAALGYSVKAAGFGQRPSGSDAIAKLRTWIVDEV